MASLVVAGDVSGSVTLSAPSAAGSVTITLPSSSGTMAVTGGSPSFATLTVTGDATISGLTVGKGTNSQTYNTALGVDTLKSASLTGNYNTGIGREALYSNTTGLINTAVGNSALYANTTGQENIAIGSNTLDSNTTGSYNTGVGRDALTSNTTASNNTAVGYQAGYTNTTGTRNTFLGYQAGYTFNDVGSGNNYNTFVGYQAGYYISTGVKNSILGAYNGNQGGLDIRTLSNYIVLSDGDGNPRIITNPSGNTLFGSSVFLGSRYSQVGIDLNGRDDALFIQNYGSGLGWGITFRPSASASGGNGDVLNFTNTSFTQVGKVTTTSSATAYATSSDYRLKENIAPMTGALETIAKLKPVTFTWKADGKDGQGFIAHELQAIVPDAVSGEKDALDKDGNPDYQGVDASFLVATLTAAIQELNAKVEAQAAEIAALKGAN